MSLNVAGSLSADEDWWQFRGPTGEGHTRAKHLPLKWNENQEIVWKTAIHDRGWSSPVICGNQIWMTTSTGEELWKVGHNGFSIVPRPVYGHGLVFLVTDHDHPELWADLHRVEETSSPRSMR